MYQGCMYYWEEGRGEREGNTLIVATQIFAVLEQIDLLFVAIATPDKLIIFGKNLLVKNSIPQKYTEIEVN